MDAEELKQYDWENPPTKQLPRHPLVQMAYFASMGTEHQEQFMNMVQSIKPGEVRFIENNFPYDVKEPIKHSCLWYNGTFTPDDVIEFLHTVKVEYITFFENDAKFKSIPEVSHYHVFHY